MTYMYPVPAQSPPPKKRRNAVRLALIVALGTLIGLVLLAVAVSALSSAGTASAAEAPSATFAAPLPLTQATARRECRVAALTEFHDRSGSVATTDDVITAVQGADIQEAWKTDNGWSVNVTVHYTLTVWPLAPVVESLDLTCFAGGTDDAPVTTVTNLVAN